jgi:predicted dehydrogenase
LIRLGLIGAGPWGQNYIKTIEGLPEVELTGVARRTGQNWREMLTSSKIDGVIVATPPSTHAEMVEGAIRAGIPCMVEKPLTTDLEEALRLQNMVGDALVLVDHTQLFNPGYLALKHDALRFGQVRSIVSEAGNWGPFRPDYNALWDYAPHDLSMCLDLLGTLPTKVKLQDEYVLTLEFPSDVRATIKVSNRLREKVRRLSIECASGKLVFDDLAQKKSTEDMPLRRAVQAFVDGIRGGPRDMFGLKLGVEIVRILASVQHPT